MNLTDLTLSESSSMLQTGEITSLDLTQAVLERIAALDGKLHSFLHVANDSALAQAEAADLSRKNQASVERPLLGYSPGR